MTRISLKLSSAFIGILAVLAFTIGALSSANSCINAALNEPCSTSFILSSGVFTALGGDSTSSNFRVFSGIFTIPTPTLPTPTPTLSVLNIYLPVISRQNTPTPTPTPTPTHTPIPPPPAKWRQLSNSNAFNANAIAVANGQLFVADQASNNPSTGLYHTQSCADATAFALLLANVEGLDLTFNGSQGLLGTKAKKVFYSTNQGNNWSQTNSTFQNDTVFSVVFTGGSTAYAATDNGLYQSGDNGVAWQRLPIVSPTRFNALYYDATSNLLWVGTYDKGVWNLPVGSTAIAEQNNGLPNTASDRRIQDFALQGADLYIGTSNGVYRRNGAGGWNSFGLSGITVLTLQVVGERIYAGTGTPSSGGWGIWHRPLNDTSDWVQESGLPSTLTVRGLYFDSSGFCKDSVSGRNALLAATMNGVWVYR